MSDPSDDEEEGGGGAWIVSYADLAILLFAAFVVLYGITPQGKSMEIIGIASSIRESFIPIPDEIPERLRTAERFDGKMSFVEATRDSTINPAIKKYNRVENEIPHRSKELQQLEITIENMVQGEGLSRSLRKGTEFERSSWL